MPGVRLSGCPAAGLLLGALLDQAVSVRPSTPCGGSAGATSGPAAPAHRCDKRSARPPQASTGGGGGLPWRLVGRR